jgi:hypothetical protein
LNFKNLQINTSMNAIHKTFYLIPSALVVLALLSAVSPSPQEKNRKKKKQQVVFDTLSTNPSGKGVALRIEFTKGTAHNHPLMAVWIEDTSGNYIQTLYVARSVATGIFAYGDASTGQWTQGEIRRPAALPYWAHKRGIREADGLFMPTPENPVPDAYSGATPKNDFILNTRLDNPGTGTFYVLLEINQPWDWNEYWTNSKYPDDYEYKTSAQPAVVYRATIHLNSNVKEAEMKVIGHSHYSGKDGTLNPDLSTLTNALQIAGKIIVKVE